MTAGINAYGAELLEYTFYGINNGVYVQGTSGALANGAESAMGRAIAFNSLSQTTPEGTSFTIAASGEVLAAYRVRSFDAKTASAASAAVDQNFLIALDGRKIYTQGADEYLVNGSRTCNGLNSMTWVVNQRARSVADDTTRGEKGWKVQVIRNVEAEDLGDSEVSGTDGTTKTRNLGLTYGIAATDILGVAFSNANHGLKYGTDYEFWSEYPMHAYSFVGDGSLGSSGSEIVLTYTPAAANANSVLVSVNGVLLTYTTDYTVDVSTKEVTFEAAAIPAAGENVVIWYKFIPEC